MIKTIVAGDALQRALERHQQWVDAHVNADGARPGQRRRRPAATSSSPGVSLLERGDGPSSSAGGQRRSLAPGGDAASLVDEHDRASLLQERDGDATKSNDRGQELTAALE